MSGNATAGNHGRSAPGRLCEHARGGWLRWGGVAVLLAVPWVPGCYSPPRRISQLTGNATTAAALCEVEAPVEEAGLWVKHGMHGPALEPSAVLTDGRRVVVTAFEVEFVDFQFQLPIPRQFMIKTPPVSPNPFHVAARAIGVGRRSSWLSEEQQQALAADLYNAFVDDLQRRGLDVVSQDELRASHAYAALRKKAVVRSSPLFLLNPIGSDVGTVMHTRTVAAPGLCVVRALPRARAAAEAEILCETRADVALAVRLRVGTYREEPALERRSRIRVTTCEGSSMLRARHSLVSDRSAVDGARFIPIVGRVEPLESAIFSGELAAMLPKFVDLAFAKPAA